MKYRRFLALALVFVMLLSYGCARKDPDHTQPADDTVGSRETTVSLNGEWDFYVDTIENTGVYKNRESVNAVIPVGGEYTTSVSVRELGDNSYVKLRARMLIPEDAGELDGCCIGVRAGSGETVYTDVSYYRNGQVHWIDLRVNPADLSEGENKISLSSTMDCEITLMPEYESCLQVKTASYGSKWTVTTVPGAAEKSVTLSHLDQVRPDNYNGVVWYRKTVSLAKPPEGTDWWLCFDAVDYRAEVWLNGYFLGSHENGYTAFDFCLSGLPEGAVREGDNELVVRVTDQDWNNGLTDDDIHIMDTLAGFVQDTRKLNYCGIWQSVYLEARGVVSAEDVFVQTLDTDGTVRVSMTLHNPASAEASVRVSAAVEGGPETALDVTVAGNSSVNVQLPDMKIGNVRLWSVHDPYRYTLNVTVSGSGGTDRLSQKFGVRTVGVEGTKVTVNGDAVFLTGMLHWGSYYDNYTPAVSREQVRYEILSLKEDGFNTIKYCLFSPPDYVLDLCDELGMYVYIEYPNWNPSEWDVTYERSDVFYERAYLQMMEMVVKDRKFACVVASDFNCEDLGYTEKMDDLMRWCVSTAKELAPGRLYADNSTNGVHKYGDFATCHPYYQVNCYEDMLDQWILERGNEPLFLGEFADISVLRDLTALKLQESEEYSWYHDYYQDYDQAQILRDAGYSEEQVQSVIAQSVLNAQELRKYYIEASKTNNHVAGLFLTHISESPNGWADGWFDDLNQKHFDPEVIYPAANEVALLLERQTVNYRAGGAAIVGAGLSLYGGYDLENACLSYTLSAGDRTVQSGTVRDGLQNQNGMYYRVGDITLSFPNSDTAVRYTLTLELTQNGTVLSRNSWNLWAYPQNDYNGSDIAVYDPRGTAGLAARYPNAGQYSGITEDARVVVTTEMTSSLLTFVSNGGKVIYIGQGSGPITAVNNWDYNRFSFAFCGNPDNPLVQSLDSLGYGGLQFLDLATQWHLEGGLTPEGNLIGRYGTTVGTIGSYLAEFSVGQGTLLQCTLRLGEDGFVLGGGILTHESLSVRDGDNPLGAYLLDQMIRYLREK